jgi:DnaD and phage-associated domain
MESIVDILKSKYYQIPQVLLFNYKKLGLSETELIVIIYLCNDIDNNYNPKKISNDLNVEMKTILEIINNLSEKGFLNLSIMKINNVRNEIINLDILYEKLAFLLMKKDTKKGDSNLFEKYEKELGRGLTPTEYEIINGWVDSNYSEELILLALKEAVYNGVTNFRYIDRIIFEWHKKGVKTKEDVEKNRKEFKKNKENKDLFDYDWLNDSENS